ncbi:MAG: hypothetical protein K2I67_00410 [Malacoplasma sp.]|nr:hypothetical protein [Malacoplasma sp.]
MLDDSSIPSNIISSPIQKNIYLPQISSQQQDKNEFDDFHVDNIIDRQPNTNEYAENFGSNPIISNSQIEENQVNNDINLSLFGFKNPVEKSYSDEFIDYLPKRKIRKILFEKYGINSKEIVDFLYSKAVAHKWNEIGLEKWLLNPSNFELLKKKLNRFKKIPNNNEIKTEPGTKICENKLPEKQKPQETESISYNKNFSVPSVVAAPQSLHSIKDELKSVIIEENYRKMQFDMQTEVLKNYISDKFSNLSANLPIINGYDFFERKSAAGNHFKDSNLPSYTPNNSTPLNGSEIKKEGNNNQNSEELLKKVVSEEIEKITANFNDRFSDSINNLNSHVSYLSESLREKIVTLEEQMSDISDKFKDNQGNDLEKKIQNIVSDFKDDLILKLENIEKDKHETIGILNNKVNEVKNALFEKLEEEIEKNVLDIKNKTEDLDSRLNAIMEDVEMKIDDSVSQINLANAKSEIIEEDIDDESDDADKINSIVQKFEKALEAKFKSEDTQLKDDDIEPKKIEPKNDEKQMDIFVNIENTKPKNLDNLIEKVQENENNLESYTDNNSKNLYDSFLESNNGNKNEIFEEKNIDETPIVDSDPIVKNEKSFELLEKNMKINEVIDKSIDDISEVIDSLQSLNVNDEIIQSFEETSKRFKNIK